MTLPNFLKSPLKNILSVLCMALIVFVVSFNPSPALEYRKPITVGNVILCADVSSGTILLKSFKDLGVLKTFELKNEGLFPKCFMVQRATIVPLEHLGEADLPSPDDFKVRLFRVAIPELGSDTDVFYLCAYHGAHDPASVAVCDLGTSA